MLDRIKRKIFRNKLVRLVLNKLDHITLPGFEGNSLYKVGKFFIKGAFDEELNLRTSYLAYSFFIALFPAIIFFFTAIPYLPIKNLDVEIMNQMRFLLPHTVYETLKSTIVDIVRHQRGDLLSLGFISAIFFSSNGFLSMIKAFNRHKRHKSNPFKDRIRSLILTFLVFLILMVSVTVIVFTTVSVNWIKSKNVIDYSFWTGFYNAFEFVTLFVLLFLIFSSLYFIGSSLTLRWKFISPGSLLSTVLSFLATELFAYYVNHFDSYNKLYGSIGTIISLMLLIYFNSMIILIGFELNYSIYRVTKEKINKVGLH